jgi:hypothetical protein
VVVFTLLIAIACSSSNRYRWYPSVLNAISVIRPETLAEEWILPALINLSMRNKRLRPYRERG